jgi:glycosyltransferase involved in cell wall biosynthesis
MSGHPECVIVMPAYNEQACIVSVCLEWLSLAEARGFVLMVVDDGSRDRTGTLLDELAASRAALRVSHQANRGHGAAVLQGYRDAIDAGALWVFQVDSDGQFTPDDFEALWREREHSPFVAGYRKDRDDTWLRKALSGVNRRLTQVLFNVRLRDPNVPYRLMKADLLGMLMEYAPKRVFAPNAILSAMAAGSGLEVREVAVRHRARLAGQASIGGGKAVTLGFRCLAEMLRFRLRAYSRFRDACRMRGWR